MNRRFKRLKHRDIVMSNREMFDISSLRRSRSNYYAASMQKFQFCSLQRSKSNRISMVPLLCSVNINKMETFEFCSLRRLKSSDDPTEFPQFYYRQINES